MIVERLDRQQDPPLSAVVRLLPQRRQRGGPYRLPDFPASCSLTRGHPLGLSNQAPQDESSNITVKRSGRAGAVTEAALVSESRRVDTLRLVPPRHRCPIDRGRGRGTPWPEGTRALPSWSFPLEH